jgi:hypothetical protein
MKERLGRFWRAFVNFAVPFSFLVNLALVLVLVLAVNPLLQAKRDIVEPLLTNLDSAFLGLSETNIQTTVPVQHPIPIRFDLPLDQPLGLDFDLPVRQDTTVVLTQDTPIPNTVVYLNNVPVRTTVILPAGTPLPIRLDFQVPVETTIPVQMTVPVSTTVLVEMNIPVSIPLGPSGLDPAVQRLRDVFGPLRAYLATLPDRLVFGR